MKRALHGLLGTLLLATAWAGPREATDVPGAKGVLDQLKAIHSEGGMRSAIIGYCQIALTDGKVVVAYDADTSLVPASTMKVITTAAALELLGPDFRFETKLKLAGEVDAAGVLQGDVIIEGSGDPTLAEDGTGTLFGGWRAALKKAGVKSIAGRVIGDERIFDTRGIPDTWAWNDIGNYFGCGAYGINIRENSYNANFDPGSVGGPAKFLSASPRPPGVTFINEMGTGTPSSGDQGYIFAGPYAELVYLRGTLPGGRSSFTIKGSLPDPARYTADAFTDYLKDKGIAVAGASTTSRLMQIAGESMPQATAVIDTTTSGSMQAILTECNLWSRNLYAESLLKRIGREAKGEGSTVAGAEAVAELWKKRGVDLGSLTMADGSGLSRANQISARQMAGILAAMAQGENGAAFKKTLPVAGRSGTLRSVGKGTAAEGRVHAKSGTINRVKCYAGYIDGQSGQRYAFAIFINGDTLSNSGVVGKITRVLSRAAGM